MKQPYVRGTGKATDSVTGVIASGRPVLTDALEQIVREGARRLLAEALEREVDEFLERGRYARTAEFRGHRNGFGPERTVGVGLGAVPVRVPRVRDVPVEIAPEGFQSQIVRRYQRISRTTQRLLAQLYLEGLATGDFEPTLRALLGETAPLSPSSVSRLKADWQEEFTTWRARRLDGQRYLYLWVDGIYLRAGDEEEKTALLCVSAPVRKSPETPE